MFYDLRAKNDNGIVSVDFKESAKPKRYFHKPAGQKDAIEITKEEYETMCNPDICPNPIFIMSPKFGTLWVE